MVIADNSGPPPYVPLPEGEQVFMIAMSKQEVVNVVRVDWRYELTSRQAHMDVRLVYQPDRLAGLQGEGKVLWIGPNAYRLYRGVLVDVRQMAESRGFEIKYHVQHPRYYDPRRIPNR